MTTDTIFRCERCKGPITDPATATAFTVEDEPEGTWRFAHGQSYGGPDDPREDCWTAIARSALWIREDYVLAEWLEHEATTTPGGQRA